MSNTIKHIGGSLAVISMLAGLPTAAALAAAPLLSQGSWTLHSVSSQELVGEDGAATNAFDGDAGTIWHTEWFDGSLPHQISVDLGANYVLEAFRYLPRPYTGSSWQTNGRIKDYEFFVSADGINWGAAVAAGTLANTTEEKEITFPQATGRFVRLVALSEVNDHPRWISMAELNLRGIVLDGNNLPTAVDDAFSVPSDSANNSLAVLANDTDPDLPQDSLVIDSVGASAAGATLSHDGSVVLYTPPPGYSGIDSFTYALRDGAGATDSAQVRVQVGATPVLLPRAGWNIVSVTSEELVGENGAAANVLDGNSSTIWHTEWFEGSLPHELVLDLGARHALHAFRYLPRPYSGSSWQTNGRIKDFEIYVSEDATTWGTPAAVGTLANTAAEKEVVFDGTRVGRYVRLVALSEVNGHPRWISMAELNLVGLSASGNAPPSATNDAFSVAGDSSQNLLPVLENDTDPDPGDTLSIASLGVSQQGATLSHDGMQVRYTPRTGFTGGDSFSYVIRDNTGATDSATVTVQVGSAPALLSRAGWSIESVSSEELVNEDGAAANTFDGDPATIWHTEWWVGSLPQEIVFDLGASYTLHAFRYLPRPYTGKSWQTNGRIKDFAFYVSDTAGDWGTAVATGSLANTEFEKEVAFATPKSGRYARLVALSEVNGHPRWISMAEFNLLGTSGDGPVTPPSGSAHYWRLDETQGKSFIDELGGLSGNCVDCPAPAPGIIRGGQDFAASTAGITIPASTSMDWDADQDFTIQAWIRSSACSEPQAFVGRVGLASGARWSLGCRDGVALFEVDDGIGGNGPRILRGSRTISDGRWHHVTAVRDALSGQLRLYVDGQEDGRIQAGLPYGVPLAGAEMTIGYLGDSQDERRYSGMLDEIAIRGQSLSAARIDRHFNDAIAGLGLGYDSCPSNPVRIMPLGDSNTERTGYRRPLSIAMLSEGYQKDFVGSRSSTCAEPCAYDPDHEGHSGWRPSDIAAALPGWLDSTPPDVILLHIGTNELDVPGVVDILDIVKQHDPRIVVLLARIINRQVYHPETTAFNDEVEALAASRIAVGDRVRIVDHESALLYPDDMSDMLHPNSVGFGKMKEVWLRDLRRFVPACSNAAPIFVSQPILEATTTSSYEYDAVASGVPSASYALLEGPDGLFVHPDTGRVSWPAPVAGSHQVRILASNALGDVTQAYTLAVD